jgi:hypothetical protein
LGKALAIKAMNKNKAYLANYFTGKPYPTPPSVTMDGWRAGGFNRVRHGLATATASCTASASFTASASATTTTAT